MLGFAFIVRPHHLHREVDPCTGLIIAHAIQRSTSLALLCLLLEKYFHFTRHPNGFRKKIGFEVDSR